MNKRLERFAQNENAVLSATIVVAFAVFRTTMCPTVSFTDSGELATVATTLGIAHPTGYPLWTVIARIATTIPIGAEPIVRLNTLSGLITAMAIGFFFKFILVLLRSAKLFKFTVDPISRSAGWIPLAGASSATLIFAFSSTVWAQSVEIEVYALHLMLILAASFLFVGGIEEQLGQPGHISRRLILFSFVLGLSFANHMTTILLAPAFLYLFFASIGFNSRSRRIISVMIPFFLLGLSLYTYLPIRSLSGPVMDWGRPVSLQRLWWHFTGKQYQTWMFAGWPVVQKQLTYFATNFPTEFHWIVILPLVYGAKKALDLSNRLFMFLIVLFITCLAYTVNYDINEIDPYFILAYVACGVFVGIGILQFFRWVSNRPPSGYKRFALILLLVLPIVQGLNNRQDVDQSRNYQVEDFVKNAFADLEPNAVVFTSLWDYFVSPSYYVQLVRHERPDIVIIDRDLLQNRTWYFSQFSRHYPGILEKSAEKVNAFLVELNKYEQDEPFSYQTIKSSWDALLRDLISKLIVDHPVYVDPRIAAEFPQEFEGIPQGLLIRLVKTGEMSTWKPLNGDFRPATFSNYVTADLKRYLVSMYTFHALWLSNNGHRGDAQDALRKALSIDPGFLPALRLKVKVQN